MFGSEGASKGRIFAIAEAGMKRVVKSADKRNCACEISKVANVYRSIRVFLEVDSNYARYTIVASSTSLSILLFDLIRRVAARRRVLAAEVDSVD